MVEHKMYCPICKKEYIEEALHIGGVLIDKKHRLVVPCEIHTQKERQENYRKECNR